MATKVEYHTWSNLLPHVVVFDLEFVGDITNPDSCALWEIGATALSTQESFKVVVNPGIGLIPEPHEGCFPLTHEFLESNAVTLKKGLQMFCQWVSQYRIMVSHNCFKSDVGVLKRAFDQCNLPYPNVLFLDSLLILRQHVKLTNYKLECVYQHYIHNTMEQHHRALPDAQALKQILLHMGPLRYTTYAYPMTLTSLQNIKGVGHACEISLINSGICSIEELETKLMTVGASMLMWHGLGLAHSVRSVIDQLNLPAQDTTTICDDVLWRINKKHNIVKHGD
tara:strand:- start:1175 stop:2017 length:843 start_codon:yes stop_codon:yes gene_type:complete